MRLQAPGGIRGELLERYLNETESYAETLYEESIAGHAPSSDVSAQRPTSRDKALGLDQQLKKDMAPPDPPPEPTSTHPTRRLPPPPQSGYQPRRVSVDGHANGGSASVNMGGIPEAQPRKSDAPLVSFAGSVELVNLNISYPSISNCGRWLVGIADDPPGYHKLWRIPADGLPSLGAPARDFFNSGLGRYRGESRDGTKLLLEKGNRVCIVDERRGRKMHRLPNVGAVCFSPDGSLVGTTKTRRNVTLWDSNTGSMITTFSGMHENITCVAISPDNELVAVGGNGGAVCLWEAQTGRLRWRVAHEGRQTFLDVNFAPDGRWLTALPNCLEASVVDVTTGRVCHTLPCTLYPIPKFSRTGRLFACTAARCDGIAVYDATTMEQRFQLIHPGTQCSDFDFAPSGKLMATVSPSGSVFIWEMKTGCQVSKHQLDNVPGNFPQIRISWSYREGSILISVKTTFYMLSVNASRGSQKVIRTNKIMGAARGYN